MRSVLDRHGRLQLVKFLEFCVMQLVPIHHKVVSVLVAWISSWWILLGQLCVFLLLRVRNSGHIHFFNVFGIASCAISFFYLFVKLTSPCVLDVPLLLTNFLVKVWFEAYHVARCNVAVISFKAYPFPTLVLLYLLKISLSTELFLFLPNDLFISQTMGFQVKRFFRYLWKLLLWILSPHEVVVDWFVFSWRYLFCSLNHLTYTTLSSLYALVYLFLNQKSPLFLLSLISLLLSFDYLHSLLHLTVQLLLIPFLDFNQLSLTLLFILC